MLTDVKWGTIIAGDGTIRKETVVSGFSSEYEMWKYYDGLFDKEGVSLSRQNKKVTLKTVWVGLNSFHKKKGLKKNDTGRTGRRFCGIVGYLVWG